jgi:hypothetical protein
MILEPLARMNVRHAPSDPTVAPAKTISRSGPIGAVEKLILEILKSSTERRTGAQIINSLSMDDSQANEVDIEGALASPAGHGMVSYQHDANPPGYGLFDRDDGCSGSENST